MVRIIPYPHHAIVPQYFTTVIPTLTHCYFTRRTADQQTRTYHVFADHNCLHAMIDLLNKSPLIKAQVTASVNLPHFVSFVKQKCFRRYENDCYVCNGSWTCTLPRVWSPSLIFPSFFFSSSMPFYMKTLQWWLYAFMTNKRFFNLWIFESWIMISTVQGAQRHGPHPLAPHCSSPHCPVNNNSSPNPSGPHHHSVPS